MKKIPLLFLSLSIVLNFFYPSLTFAQQSDPKVEIVDISYDDTIYGTGETATGTFNIVNKSQFDIGNIYYEIAITGRDSDKMPFQRSYGFSERVGPFFVRRGDAVPVNFSFKLPDTKPTEEIALRFSAFLKNNQKIGWSLRELRVKGEVASQMYVIYPEFRVGKETLNFMHPNTVYKGEEASFVYTLKNDSDEDIRVEPQVTVRDIRNQKDVYAKYSENKVTVPAKSSLKVSNNVKVFEDDPGIYAAQISFIDEEGKTRGIPIVFQYVVDGNILSIDSISVDPALRISKGKEFNINVLYAGKPIDVRNPSSNRLINDASVYVKVTDTKNNIIAEFNELRNFEPQGEMIIPVIAKRSADSFKIEVKIAKDGETLDELSLEVPALVKENNMFINIAMFVGLLIIITIIILIMKKKIKIPWLKMMVISLMFLGTASVTNAATPTASILIGGRSDISIGTGAIIPAIVWSGTGGVAGSPTLQPPAYSTSVSVNSATECPGVTVGQWKTGATVRGNTASGTYYPYPAANATTVAPANLEGCEITYTYTVVDNSPTSGNPFPPPVKIVSASAIIRYVPAVIPTPSIYTSLLSDEIVFVGENKPTITWSSGNGASYKTTITRTGSCTSAMPASVIWTSGVTASGSAPSYVHPTTNTSPTISASMSGCDLTYTYEVTSPTGNKATRTAVVKHRSGTRPTASMWFEIFFVNPAIIKNTIEVGNGVVLPVIKWSGSGGKSSGGYVTTVSVNNASLCPGVATGTWANGNNTAPTGATPPSYPYYTSTNSISQPISPSNINGCEITYTYKVTATSGAINISSIKIKYVASTLASDVKLKSNILSDNTVMVGEPAPIITWSSVGSMDGGQKTDMRFSKYDPVTKISSPNNDPINFCGSTNTLWAQGNTASGTAYAYPTTGSRGYPYVYPSNGTGISVVPLSMNNCDVVYTYKVISQTGNEAASSPVTIKYRNLPRPKAEISYVGSGAGDYTYTVGPLLSPGNLAWLSDGNNTYKYETLLSVNDPALCSGVTAGLWSKGNTMQGSATVLPYIKEREGCDATYTYQVTDLSGIMKAKSVTIKYRNVLASDLTEQASISFGPTGSIVYPRYLIDEADKPYVNSLWSGISIEKYQVSPFEPNSVYINISPRNTFTYIDPLNPTSDKIYHIGMGPYGVVNPQGLFISYGPTSFNDGQIPLEYTLEQNDDAAYENFWSKDGNNKGKKAPDLYLDYDSTGPFFQTSFLHGGQDETSPLYVYMRYPDPLYGNGGIYGASPFGFERDDLNCVQGVDSDNCNKINTGPQILISDEVFLDPDSDVNVDGSYCYASTDDGITEVSSVLPGQPVTWHFRTFSIFSDLYYRWVGNTGDSSVPTRTNFSNIPSQISTPVTDKNTLCSYIEKPEVTFEYFGGVINSYQYNASSDKCCAQILTCDNEECLNPITTSKCREVPNLYADTWSNVPELSTVYSESSVDQNTKKVDMELQYVRGGVGYSYGPSGLSFPPEEEGWDYLQCKPLSVGNDICPNIVGNQAVLPSGFSSAPSDAVIASGLATTEDKRCFPTSLAMLGGIELKGYPRNPRPGDSVKWTFSLTSPFFEGVRNSILYTIPRFATITWTGDLNDPDGISQDFEKLNPGSSGNNKDRRVTYTQDETTPTVTVTVEDEFKKLTDTAFVTIGGTCTDDDCLVFCDPSLLPEDCDNGIEIDNPEISNFTISSGIANENDSCYLSWTTNEMTESCVLKNNNEDTDVPTNRTNYPVGPGTYTLICANYAPEIITAGPRTCLQNPDLREN